MGRYNMKAGVDGENEGEDGGENDNEYGQYGDEDYGSDFEPEPVEFLQDKAQLKKQPLE